jgi:pimeloyl-ACP methyl ester carboxylesterase
VKDFVLVGHSMGGKIAQILAGRRPAGLRAVTATSFGVTFFGFDGGAGW